MLLIQVPCSSTPTLYLTTSLQDTYLCESSTSGSLTIELLQNFCEGDSYVYPLSTSIDQCGLDESTGHNASQHKNSYMFGDNKSVVTSSTLLFSPTSKRHHLASCHRVHEAIAPKYLAFFWKDVKANPSE